ncbi:hypothetical protein [Allobranchiibius sp. GilTou38]|uniref:hypothetical protein n=1 Tax=Allobranchiibius sp. GilTou38 TaxID=2815210 RepID=UPI001AA1577B|nr:hypothetical protein [Allobranchiibius sp. GilTou38]MBO1766613.1 hypothetical protein [Allobranchiibius sp. GilTou38]
MLRPGRADSVRIRPRFALRSMRWSELRGVQTPGRWDTEVYVMNLAGRPRATGFSLDYLDDLVRMSGRASVPRLSELGPPVRREPLPRSREQTQRDLAARVERVRALNAELLSDPDSPTPANETGVGNESPNP